MLKCKGPGAAQVRRAGAAVMCCRGSGTESLKGLLQSWLYIPLQSHTDSLLPCAQRKSSFHMVGKGGGTRKGATHLIPLFCFSKRTAGAACPANAM